MYVEDNKDIRDVLLRVLRMAYPGVVVDAAVNGADGLQLFMKKRHQIIVTDIHMPIMDGVQMTTEIRQIDGDALIIATTASVDTLNVSGAIGTIIDKYIPKPIDITALLNEIAGYMNGTVG